MGISEMQCPPRKQDLNRRTEGGRKRGGVVRTNTGTQSFPNECTLPNLVQQRNNRPQRDHCHLCKVDIWVSNGGHASTMALITPERLQHVSRTDESQLESYFLSSSLVWDCCNCAVSSLWHCQSLLPGFICPFRYKKCTAIEGPVHNI